MGRTVIAFDLYGTILSTESIAGELAKLYGQDKAQSIASLARRYQLEYTWRANSMGIYRSFSDLTRWSFRQATKEIGLELTPEQEEHVMNAYNGLDTFPDVDDALKRLAESSSIDSYIFSNGTADMIASSLKTSPSLSQASNVFTQEKLVSIDSIQVFKPDPRTYKFMAKTAGLESQLDKVWLVSSNPFDVVGATAVGLKSVWIDRGRKGWSDGLAGSLDVEPTVITATVNEAVQTILRQSESSE